MLYFFYRIYLTQFCKNPQFITSFFIDNLG
nr:MAG TPA: hypothetical protein [Caudoviricetes sp.]DAP47444.1 MAG TPA: hypothetical protein [Caudoviricetes sp.]DAP97789.1 MAG TPA: hypothetical protein [Caudoviricetes sp.]